MEMISIDNSNRHLVETFLSIAGNTLNSFRYFSRRTLSALDNHICTFLFLDDSLPVCYGHLDKERDIVWLGIAVAEKYQGKGLGKLMLQTLLQHGHDNNVSTIYLTVDKNNLNARNLYEKYRFVLVEYLNENIVKYKYIRHSPHEI